MDEGAEAGLCDHGRRPGHCAHICGGGEGLQPAVGGRTGGTGTYQRRDL